MFCNFIIRKELEFNFLFKLIEFIEDVFPD